MSNWATYARVDQAERNIIENLGDLKFPLNEYLINTVTPIITPKTLFPFYDNAGNVTLSSNTTWEDSCYFKKVGTLTINSGVTLRIGRSPFIICANEIVFGNSSSIIDASGPNGADGGNSSYSEKFALGGYAVSGNSKACGGAGGAFIVIFANTIKGANGIIRANGGNGWRNTTNATEMTYASGQGCFRTQVSNTGAGRLVANGGYSTAYEGLEGADGNSSSHYAGGGSGIGGGGGAYSSSSGANGSSNTKITLPAHFVRLLAAVHEQGVPVLGGGGGGAIVHTTGTYNRTGGGGGGGILIVTKKLECSPTLTANGGTGINAGNGGSGKVITLVLEA
jgi:hypothetical protein